MNKTHLILRTHLTTLPQFVYNAKLESIGNLLRQYSEKKVEPKEQHKKAMRKFEQECDVCSNMFKPCGECLEPQSESEKKLPGCMPFSENIPMPQPEPQFTEECLSPDCPVDCGRSKRTGPPRCPQSIKLPEHEECKTTGKCENKRDLAKETD